MTPYSERPWLRSYPDGLPHALPAVAGTARDLFASAVTADPDAPALHYFGRTISYGELDRLSDAFAAVLQARGVEAGDRVALYLQNVPQFPIALVGAWKAGAIGVPVNPMWKRAELARLVADCEPAALVTHDDLWRDVAADVVPGSSVRGAFTTSALDLLGDAERPSHLPGPEPARTDGAENLLTALAAVDAAPRVAALRPDDPALLSYTSGTTGPPKGAINTHANLVASARTLQTWCGLGADDVVLGVSPLSHITGMLGHLVVAFRARMAVVLTYRFDGPAVLDLIERYRPTFTVASITFFRALMNVPGHEDRDVSSLRIVLSGGTAVTAATADAVERWCGAYVHGIYGMTETTSPTHIVPIGTRAPRDAATGALAVGLPVFGTDARIVGDDGEPLPVGETGVVVVDGPQVVPGYWGRDDETAALHVAGGGITTGDVGFMTADGWFFVVDRQKDMINASGFKVWPREVEEVLDAHPDVREVAVVGVPDEYRGETVKAFVVLHPGATATSDQLVGHAKEQLAAYKYPRQVEIVDELPKTATGKVLRRALRDDATQEATL